MPDRNILLFILIAVSGLIVNLIAFFEWDSTYITNDGVQYLSTASNWLLGNGFSTNALMYSPHFQGIFPGPQTVWPPGYPFVLSLLGSIGLNLTTAGLIINLAAHALASVLVYFILRRMRVSTHYAILCAVLFYTLAIPWNFARGIITEPLFTCFILGTILSIPVPGRSKFITWLLCGTLIAGAIYIRYSAVVLAASVGAGLFLYLIMYDRQNWRSLLCSGLNLAVLSVIPLVAFLQLMYRTNMLTGTVERNAGTRVPETLYQTIRQWGAHSADLLGYRQGGLFSHEVGVLLFLCSVALVLSLVVYAGVIYREDDDQDHHSEHARYSRVAGFVIISHASLFFVYLSYCALSDSPLEILTRYIYQIYSGIYVLFCVLMYGLLNRVTDLKTGEVPALLKNSLTALVVMYLFGQANEATSTQRFFAEGQAASKTLSLPVNEDLTLANYIENCFRKSGNQGSLWSTHGQHLHFNTGKPTLTLAEIYTSEPPDLEKIEQQIDTYNIKLMLFLNDDLNLNDAYKRHLQEIKKWLIENGHKSVTLQSNAVNSHTSVNVFQINQQCE